ncbi:MAG TPA: iron-siderophore ABC transporter substrate-binding protein [Trichocoleus sp.]
MRKRWVGLFALVLGWVISCGFDPQQASIHLTAGVDTAGVDSACRTVPHDLGETTLCGEPKAVVALSPHILDSMLSLGVQPVAYAETVHLKQRRFDRPAEQIPYLGDRITTQPVNLGDRKSPSLEALASVKPDLILGESWMHGKIYHQLSQIAPTLLFSDTKGEIQTWQNDIGGIANALNRKTEAEQLHVNFSQQIEAAKTALAPVVQRYPKVLLISSNQLTRTIYTAADSTAGNLMRKIGFELVRPQGLEDWGLISFEVVPQIEADIVIVFAWDEQLESPAAKVRQQWASNPLLKTMPVFQAGRVFFADYQLWGSNIRGPIADQLILEALPKLLGHLGD